MARALAQADAQRAEREYAVQRYNAETLASQTRRGRGIHIIGGAFGWKIEIEGGGSNPFEHDRYTRRSAAESAIELWNQSKARSSDAYTKE